MSDITVVTAFFDIGRGNLPQSKHGRVLPHYQHRTTDTYFEFFGKLAKLENDMVIYTTQDNADKVYNLRKKQGLENKTIINVMESYIPKGFESYKEKIQKIMDDPNYYGKIVNPHLIEYWHADYVLVNIFKSIYVSNAIESGQIKTDLTSWIDFGYVRDDSTIPTPHKWNYDFDVDKIHFFNQYPILPERPIDNIIHTGDVYIQGCHIVAGNEKWHLLKNLMIRNMELLIQNNLIDDDQTLLLMSYLTSPENFELHKADPNDWFRIFKKYNVSK